MIALRLGVRLAFSRDLRQRWRQASIVFAASVVTLLFLTAVGAVCAAATSDARIAARSPVFAASAGETRLKVSARGIALPDFGQVPVVWLEPARSSDRSTDLVPPGLSRMPAPGEAVVSPGLLEAGYDAVRLGFNPSDAGRGPAGAIGVDGLASASEGWVYARPEPGRSLGEGGALLPIRGYGGSGPRANLETVPHIPSLPDVLVSSAWAVVAPCLFLLVTASRAQSQIREERLAILSRLGVSESRLRLLAAVEAVALAGIGGAAGLVAWWLWLRRAASLPLSQASFLPGQADPGLVVTVAVVLVVLLLAGAASALTRVHRLQARARIQLVRPRQAVPLAIAILTMGLSRWLDPYSSLRPAMLFGGMLVTFAAVPMALPVGVSRIGALFGRSGRPAIWLAGRRLGLRARNLSRPAAMAGVLVFVAGSAFALYDRISAVEGSGRPDAARNVFSVNWRDDQPGDLAQIRERLASITVVPVVQDADGNLQGFLRSCTEAADAAAILGAGQEACDRNGGLNPAAVEAIASVTGVPVTLGKDPDRSIYQILIVGDRHLSAANVMNRLAASLPAVNIDQLSGPAVPPRSNGGWLMLGWITATMILLVAIVREVGDRALLATRDDGGLWRLGLNYKQIDEVTRWSVLPPLLVSIPVGYVAAVVFALMGYELGYTVNNFARISVVAACATTISGVLLVAVLSISRRLAGSRASW